MLPDGLKRAIAANPVEAVWEPLESPITPFMSAADGVASNWAVKVPVWLANAVFCQLPAWVVCAHAGAAVAVAEYIARATVAGTSAAALASASVRIDIDRNLIRFPSVRGR